MQIKLWSNSFYSLMMEKVEGILSSGKISRGGSLFSIPAVLSILPIYYLPYSKERGIRAGILNEKCFVGKAVSVVKVMQNGLGLFYLGLLLILFLFLLVYSLPFSSQFFIMFSVLFRERWGPYKYLCSYSGRQTQMFE